MKEPMRLWFAVGLVVIVALGMLAGVMPRINGVKRLNVEATSLADRASHADNGAAELERLLTNLEEVKQTAEHGIVDIPYENDMAGLIRDLTSQLDQLGMTERSITTGKTDDLKDTLSAPMSVTMKGSFLGVVAVIDWLESLPRLVRILRLTINAPHRTAEERLSTNDNQVEAELLLNVFYDAGRLEAMEIEAASKESP